MPSCLSGGLFNGERAALRREVVIIAFYCLFERSFFSQSVQNKINQAAVAALAAVEFIRGIPTC